MQDLSSGDMATFAGLTTRHTMNTPVNNAGGGLNGVIVGMAGTEEEEAPVAEGEKRNNVSDASKGDCAILQEGARCESVI